MSWSAYASGGFVGLLEEWVYQRWFEKKQPTIKAPPQEVALPRSDSGTAIPIIYGRCRVRAPILAWGDNPQYGDNGALAGTVYQMSMLFVLGAGFAGGTHGLHGMWYSENKKFNWLLNTTPTGDGGFEAVTLADINNLDGVYAGGYVEFLNGNSSQTVVDDTDTATTYLGQDMLVYWPAASIPGLRNMLSAYLHGNGLGGDGDAQFRIGTSPAIPAYSFEASSYKDTGMPAVGIYARIGTDSNPVNALYDLFVDKLGIPAIYIESTTWDAAAVTLYNESHGYSRCIADIKEAQEHVIEILRQIAGVMFFDESSQTFKLKLIRNDYTPSAVVQINKDNCRELVNFASGGWYSIPNKIRLAFENAENNYLDDSATARNQANAVGQDGVQIEHLIEMRGVTNAALAERIAARELDELSRPLMRCRAIVSQALVRVNPGDVVRVSWTGPDISNVCFRVVAVDRGTLEEGWIALDIVQDSFYVFRGRVPEPPALIDNGAVFPGINIKVQGL